VCVCVCARVSIVLFSAPWSRRRSVLSLYPKIWEGTSLGLAHLIHTRKVPTSIPNVRNPDLFFSYDYFNVTLTWIEEECFKYFENRELRRILDERKEKNRDFGRI
jgi:hypothetical protein